MRIVFGFILLLIGSLTSTAQELLINGGAEQPLWMGWNQANPAENWTWTNADLLNYTIRPPHGGSYLFYPSNNNPTTGTNTTEIYQDISLASNITAIDAGTASYTFSGWRRGYRNTTPFNNDMDRSQVIVEYRDASGNILDNYDTGSAVFTAWTQNTDTRFAPVGTRVVRIRLISTRVSAGADNDGYHDDVSFVQNTSTCTPPDDVQLTPNLTTSYCLGSNMTISGDATPINPNYYYTWYKDGNPITTASTTYTPITKAATVAADAGIYTLRVEDGNAGSTSCYKESSVTIIIDPPTIAGTISASQEVCVAEIPDPLTGTVATGGTTSKYYKWQRATNPAGPWTTVQAYNTTTGYAPPSVLGTRYYKRIDSSGACPSVTTNTITIQTNNRQTLSPITSLIRDTLCAGENFQLIPPPSNPPFSVSFNGGFYYYWRKVQGATTILVTSPSPSRDTYLTAPQNATLADSGTYYFISQDGPTATQCKDSVKIVIRVNQGPTAKALIQSHQEICLNDPANLLTESQAGTGTVGSPVHYQWYTSSDTIGTPVLTKIPVASMGMNYDPGTPLSTQYYVRTDSVKYCTAVKTNYLKVRVNNKPILDSIRAIVNDTLCENFRDQFQLKGYIDSLTTGKQSINGVFYFTWKRKYESDLTAVTVSPAAPYTDYPASARDVVEADSGTYYLIVQDGPNAKECLDSISLKITVRKTCTACFAPDFVSIKVSSSSSNNLCTGNTLHLEKDVIQLPVTPPTFGYMYSWIRTNTLGTVVVQGPSATYQDLVINSVSVLDSGRYELVIKDGTTTPTACSEKSLPISVVVHNAITPASIGNDTTICSGNPLLPFIERTPNTGGTGSFTHQWQSSADNITFTDINNATNITYQSPPVSIITYFRRVDNSGMCAGAPSDTITVTTSAGAVAGTIASANPTICFNTKPPQAIINVSSASGGTGNAGSVTYQWQQSSDNINWTDINGANGINYTENSLLTDTMYYRRKVGMGPGNCDTTHTTSVAINVFAPLVIGNIGNDTSVCSGSTVRIKELSPAIGNSITYKWVQSTDKGKTWVQAPGNSSSKDYNTPGLTDTTWYKRVAQSPCGQDSTNAVHVSVIFRPITFAGSDSIVQKNSSLVLQGDVFGTTHYEWIPSTGLNNPFILNPTATIRNTITYILRAQDATGTCFSESRVTISIKPKLIIPNVITPNGDGVNDTWTIEDIEEYPNATFLIYNRWGNIVWKSSNNLIGWDGTNYRNGELLPDGTYFYIIDLKSIAYDEPLTGYVQIIK